MRNHLDLCASLLPARDHRDETAHRGRAADLSWFTITTGDHVHAASIASLGLFAEIVSTDDLVERLAS